MTNFITIVSNCRAYLANSSRSIELAEYAVLLVLTWAAVFLLHNAINLAGVSLFLAEVPLILIFVRSSNKQLLFVLALFMFVLAAFIFPETLRTDEAFLKTIKFTSLNLFLITYLFMLGLAVLRCAKVMPSWASTTESVFLAYIPILALIYAIFYFDHKNHDLALLQIARKTMETLVCIWTFQIIDKGIIAANAFSNLNFPLFPKIISTKETVQSLMTVAISAMLVFAITLMLTQAYASWESTVQSEIEKMAIAHSKAMLKKIEPLVAESARLQQGFKTTKIKDASENNNLPGRVDAVFFSRYSEHYYNNLTASQKNIVSLLRNSTSSPESFALIPNNDGIKQTWDFLSNYSGLGIVKLNFQSLDDVKSFFSNDILNISIYRSDMNFKQAFSDFVNSGVEAGGSPTIISTVRSGAQLWLFADERLSSAFALRSFAVGRAFFVFNTQSGLHLDENKWTFLTSLNAWPIIKTVTLPLVYTSLFTYLMLNVLIMMLGYFVLRAMQTSRGFSADYTAYIDSLFYSDQLSNAPKARPTVIEEAFNAQHTLSFMAHEITVMNAEMKNTIKIYRRFFNEMPIGILGLDKSGNQNFINEALSDICGLSGQAITDIVDIVLRNDGGGINSSANESVVNCGDGKPHHLSIFTVDRFDSTGRRDGHWGIIADRTQDKVKDAQLAQAAKLATLGQMSTEIAHELNQPLNILALCEAGISMEAVRPDIDRAKILDKTSRIRRSIDRASRIVNHMRVFGRVDSGEFAPIDVRQAIQDALTINQKHLKADGVDLVLEISERELLVMGTDTKLEQVILNLISNAKDAVLTNAEHPKIAITARREAGRIDILIKDNGGGVEESSLSKIFEPFWTTKPSGQGTGLGGSISYGIIKEMGGTITADNIDGGLVVTVSLKEFLADSPAGAS